MAHTQKIAFVGALIALSLTACGTRSDPATISFAQCLTNNGVTMYGAYWCPHCADQKALFGQEAFREIKYVECDPRGENAKPEICFAKNVKRYPTWEFRGGEKTEGVLSFSQLAEKSGCSAPQPPDVQK